MFRKIQARNAAEWQKKLNIYLNCPLNCTDLLNVDPDTTPIVMLRKIIHSGIGTDILAVPNLAMAERIHAAFTDLAAELSIACRAEILQETVRGKLIVAGGESNRARILQAMLPNAAPGERPRLIIGSVHALAAAVPDPRRAAAADFTLRRGMTIKMSDLLTRLVGMDYDDELEVTISGEFSRRGGIIDIFSPAQDFPARIEFFGDEIDSIRTFRPEDQRSIGQIEAYRVIAPHPSADADKEETEERFDFFDYADGNCALNVLHQESCRAALENFSGTEASGRFSQVCAAYDASGKLTSLHEAASMPSADKKGEPAGVYPPLAHLAGDLPQEMRFGALDLMREMLLNQVRQWLDSGYDITLAANSDGGLSHLHKWLDANEISSDQISCAVSSINQGFMLPEQKFIFLAERELFTVNAFNRTTTTKTPADKIPEASAETQENGEYSILSELEEGDYAVHLDHGICRFRGIAIAKSGALEREVMKLEFRDGAMLHIPMTQSQLVSKYLGAAGKVVLHKLGASRWAHDKLVAKSAVRAYAADMLRLQAVRAASPGIAFPPDDVEMKIFEGSFPHTDTPDQKRSTLEIKRDMEKLRPMDRLLCGDVGYGKTELAMRAAFKAVSAGFQVAVLAPTTVLAQQHYYSFRERFAEHPVNIDVLSRFRSAAEQAEIIEKLKSGGIDIIIGTHRLCNSEIKFSNLGLVVIDEEQKFGVRHKEQLRRMRAEVDVLTMSATPIPRTLYLAMAGARDLSTLQSAPQARLPVKTIIAPEELGMIATAVRSEIERGGQVYYLHNRVKTIEDCRDKLAAAMPGIRFAVAHGQMEEHELENIMKRFMDHSIDCLVCSTIIESGLDIPDANTIIIERADRFGLAELYQLRGRVGRRTNQAYAYMLLPKNELITSDARKRIAAIRRCSELGAGFQLALRDLEIRGSGNILGAEQSGHLNLIGFDLYCRLLKEEVAALKGEKTTFLPHVELAIDFVVYGHRAGEGFLPAAFPPDYIGGTRQRLNAYRRLAALSSDGDVDEFRNELVDRFGKLPEAAENLLKLTRLRIMTAHTPYNSLVVADGKVLLQKNSGNIYRDHGKVPFIDYCNPLQLRMALLREIIRRAAVSGEE